jgi:small-conductance mechanosensitive channel
MNYQEILNYSFYGNTVEQILIALLVFLVLILVFTRVASRFITRIERFAKKSNNLLDNQIVKILENTHGFLPYLLALYIGLEFVRFEPQVRTIIDNVFFVALAYYILRLLQIILGYIVEQVFLGKKKDAEANETMRGVTALILNIVLWGVGILIILSNLGINVNSLIASLGIGSIAVALAMQNILTDLFSSFMIYFDKPFEVGDYIVVGEDSGTVQKIGLKTTRITALKGNELVIPNSTLTNGRIHNFKKMKKRRVTFGFGVVYATKSAQLKKINKIIEKIFSKEDQAELFTCVFKEFGDFALQYEVIYYATTPDYKTHLEVQQSINFAIKSELEKAKISMAFPTQTIHLKK